MYSKHKLTLTGIATAILHGMMVMRVEKSKLTEYIQNALNTYVCSSVTDNYRS